MKHVGNTDVDRTKVYNGIRLTIEPLAKKRKKTRNIFMCVISLFVGNKRGNLRIYMSICVVENRVIPVHFSLLVFRYLVLVAY